jgi:hypothetical protein
VLKVTHGLYPLQTVTHPPPRLFIDFEALSKYLPAHGQQNGGRKNRLKPLHGVNERNGDFSTVGFVGATLTSVL